MIRWLTSSRSWPVKPGRIPMCNGAWRPVWRTIAGERLFLCTAKGLGCCILEMQHGEKDDMHPKAAPNHERTGLP